MADYRRHGSVLSPRGRVQRYECRVCYKKFHRSLKSVPLNLRDGYLDIEASGLKANFDVMYCWSIKPRGSDKLVTDTILNYGWSLTAEKRLVNSLNKALTQFDRIITYNGTRYDVPFVRTRSLRHGLTNFPEYMQLYHHDLYFVARSRLNLHRKNLATVAKALGVPGKTEIDWSHWEAAIFGDRKALREIERHNWGDVVVLEGVHEVMEPYYFGINKSI